MDNKIIQILAQVPMARKAEAWHHEQIPTIRSRAALEALKSLPVFAATASPMDDLPWDRDRFFIAERPDGSRFLVNTEGYNYSRYIARIPAGRRSGDDLAGACEGEQIGALIDLAADLAGLDFPASEATVGALRERAKALVAEIERRAR